MTSSQNSLIILGEQSFSNSLQNFKLCMVCNQKFKNYKRKFSGCEHDFKVCYECYVNHLNQRMQNSQMLTCPYCPKEMLLDETNHSTFFKHLAISMQPIVQEYVEKSKSKFVIRFCLVEDCGGRVPNEICEKCGKYYCPKCRQFQHTGSCQNLRDTRTSNISQQQNANIIACPRCDHRNQITEKDKKKIIKKCGNDKYCKTYICVQHKTFFNKAHHQNFHPNLIIKNKKTDQCCQIF